MTTRLIDDLDGSVAAATVCFSLDGRSFEIDLSEAHLAELRAALEPFVAVARRVPGNAASRRSSGRASAGTASRTVVAPTKPADRASTPTTAPPSAVGEREAAARSERPTAAATGRNRPPLVVDPFNPQVRIV